jgi:hypothetical protein
MSTPLPERACHIRLQAAAAVRSIDEKIEAKRRVAFRPFETTFRDLAALAPGCTGEREEWPRTRVAARTPRRPV